MKTIHHREITAQALNPYFAADALETVIVANLGQDAMRYQFGYDHFHYDASAFAAGDAYIDEMRRSALDALQRGDALPARASFGRLTHTAQDLYAHSNYIALWRELHPEAEPGETDPQLAVLLKDSRLHSGRLYYPLEALSFIPALKSYVIPLLPRDSHAWMNIDDPSRPNYDFAYAAAVKRTSLEYRLIAEKLTAQQSAQFTGRLFQLETSPIFHPKTKMQNHKSEGL
ncbi:MAG: hypothetical protein NT121_17255 [Chloroflexi bacterium]|nr:hypothetical protein [Chloroflexota bacterium]